MLLDHGADVNAKETLRGTTPLMWAADEGHAAAVKLLIERGADIKARSNPAQRGRGPALGKANDPRKAGRGAGRGARRRAARSTWRRFERPLARRRRQAAAAAAARRRRGGGAAGGRRARRRRRRRRGRRRSNRTMPRGAVGFGARAPGSRTTAVQLTPLIYAARANDLESVKVLLGGRRRHQPDHRLRLEPAAGRDAEPLLQARRVPARPRRRTRISRTRAAGCRCIWRPTTATSRAATIRSARATWTTWSSSSCCSTRAPT